MKDSFIIAPSSIGKCSEVIQSLYRLEGQIPLETETADRTGLYGHTVMIQTGNITICNDTLDCEFDIPFDDDTEANEAEIILYNLNDLTLQNIKKGEIITVTAGYQDDTGIIFMGFITLVKTQFSGMDKITQIYAVDSEDRRERELLESIAYAANTPASTILMDLIGRAGLPVAVFAPKRDYIYKKGKTISGGLIENIRKQAQVCGVSAYICKGQVYVRSILEGDSLDFTLSSATGLLELSAFEENLTAEDFSDTIHGYDVTCLLQHRITTGSIVKIKSKNVSGDFRVREGSHSYDGSNFLTKIKVIECPSASASPSEENLSANNQGMLPNLSGYHGVSIVDGLKSVGADSSFAYRKTLAESTGIIGYSGTAAQNLELLRKLGAAV